MHAIKEHRSGLHYNTQLDKVAYFQQQSAKFQSAAELMTRRKRERRPWLVDGGAFSDKFYLHKCGVAHFAAIWTVKFS
jgi:hypothetical protein